ncbi:MAG: serine hydroxymethyltransferase [Actinobacteria bacterium]|nr:serine hydroxymethyltransferase [Actinomycetota bacterium]
MSVNELGNDLEALKAFDPDVYDLILKEISRQNSKIQLIASENVTSPAVIAALGTPLTNKYAEGLPGNRYYGGCEYVDVIENIARDRLKQLLGADHANVQPHAGAQANLAAYFAFLKPGDTFMGMRLDQGGHLTHGSPVNFTGKFFNVISYGVREDTEMIDYDELRDIAKRERPKLIVAGATAYSRQWDFATIAEVARDIGAIFMVDAAHFIGLVAGGAHESPVPHADVVTFTTHKTLRGPRGAAIVCREEHAKAIDKQVFPGTQGGPLMHVISAKTVAFKGPQPRELKTYAGRIVENSRALAEALTGHGLRIVSGGTDNHLMLVDVRPIGLNGRDAEERLDRVGIVCNKNTIPFDPEKPLIGSGIRIGTPWVTSVGMGTKQMQVVADLIARTLKDPSDENLTTVAGEVKDLTSAFRFYR